MTNDKPLSVDTATTSGAGTSAPPSLAHVLRAANDSSDEARSVGSPSASSGVHYACTHSAFGSPIPSEGDITLEDGGRRRRALVWLIEEHHRSALGEKRPKRSTRRRCIGEAKSRTDERTTAACIAQTS